MAPPTTMVTRPIGARMDNVYRSPCGRIELRCGRWQEVLSDVTSCDAVITDPPYGERTHAGQLHGRFDRKNNDGGKTIALRGIPYEQISSTDAGELADRVADMAPQWAVIMTSHDLWPRFESSFQSVDRYVFAPLACVQPHSNVRLAGDGPANWAVWCCVSRLKNNRKSGALPGAYVCDPGHRNGQIMPGQKPLPLMRSIVRDYSRPNDLIVDPCAGSGTTLLAAAIEGRRAIGAEQDPKTFALAVKRLQAGYTPLLPGVT